MRRLISDTAASQDPLEILQQKIPVFEKSEHAQVDGDADDQPNPATFRAFLFSHDSAEIKIHRRGAEEKQREGRVPRAVKYVARDHEQILARFPGTDRPVRADNDDEKDDKGKRIKQHARRV